MGDVGSLSIGAILSSVFIITKTEILMIIFLFPIVLETITVIIQVGYFKITKGKRLFKMSPFHHHLELTGYKEIFVDLFFWVITMFCGLIGIYLFKKYFTFLLECTIFT